MGLMDEIYLIIRWIHVLAVGLVLGGVALEIVLWFSRYKQGINFDASIIQLYEWVFWFATGIVIMSGASNLGAFGEAVPNRESYWGKLFICKMIGVGLFLALSFIRSCRWYEFREVSVFRQSLKVQIIQASLAKISLLVIMCLIGLGILLSHGI